MGEQPSPQQDPGLHAVICQTARCGYRGTDLRGAVVGSCRACCQLVCAGCDSGYLPELGPICAPCTPPPRDSRHAEDGWELVRLCVFDLALSCGHVATVALTGWYPVSVACCDRLGGTILRGQYVPYSCDVDYVQVVSERYEHRPTGTPPPATRLLGRRARIDDPYPAAGRAWSSSGRFPAHVGATWSLDGSPDTATAAAGINRRPAPSQRPVLSAVPA